MFSSSEKLQAHIAADHGNGNYCNFCEKRSQINHLGENIYKILMTSDVIFVKVWFERRARHSYTRYTQPQLSIRGKSFREKKDLKATFCFLKHSHGCQECTFVTRTMCSLTNHMDAEHGKTCPNCDRKFPNQVSLDKHIDSCTLVVIHTVTTMFLMKTLW